MKKVRFLIAFYREGEWQDVATTMIAMEGLSLIPYFVGLCFGPPSAKPSSDTFSLVDTELCFGSFVVIKPDSAFGQV